ncbi:RNA polymerase II transcriptional coactivator KELP [Heracleum sosnowskyi]|uniref:RNA polymerase II transcriptional coactivator KELP n=1 Tax=Heracleum sosnowskyi TaxID=360622 RepID=A0AAD8HY51_9APIA|nr:RNA polymerase II transcriptional coactivator KELP [Heracleum sosnowskyi]
MLLFAGISLTANQWCALKQGIPAIEEAILQFNSRKRKCEADISYEVSGVAPQGKVSIERKEAEVCNKVSIDTPQGRIFSERKHPEADDSNTSTASVPEENIPSMRQQKHTDPPVLVANIFPNGQVKYNPSTAFHPQRIIPIPSTRLSRRNYSCWMRQISFVLNQLKIAYVLTQPCPDVTLHEEASFENAAQAKAAAKKWIDDDYLCRVNILNSLSDHLYDQYSKRMLSSKELWEELKLSFDEDFGTKISQVSKYMQYQIVDGASVLEQVQELHEIADTIIACGMRIDENFHVSAIVSKLPPSWKECRVKLLKEEWLPLSKLMYTLRVEENFRNRHRSYESSMHPKAENKFVSDTTERKRLCYESSTHSKPENKFVSKTTDKKRLCYICGNEGHISKNCGLQKWVESSNGKKNADVHVTIEGFDL